MKFVISYIVTAVKLAILVIFADACRNVGAVSGSFHFFSNGTPGAAFPTNSAGERKQSNADV